MLDRTQSLELVARGGLIQLCRSRTKLTVRSDFALSKRPLLGLAPENCALVVVFDIGCASMAQFNRASRRESMEPTEWDFRNKLLAVLSAARHKGMPYVDVESGNLFAQLGSDSKSNLRVPKCHEIM